MKLVVLEENVVRPFDGFGVAFPVDLYETAAAFVLSAVLPGVRPDGLRVEATRDGLTVVAEVSRGDAPGVWQRLREERAYGTLRRSFSLPLDIDPDRIETAFAHGVVTLTMPKKGDAK